MLNLKIIRGPVCHDIRTISDCISLSKRIIWFFYDGCPYHIETSRLICSANQWTVFYLIGTSVMKELNKLQHTEIFLLSFLKAFSPFILHLKLKRNSRFTLRKKGWSHHHAIHHFYAITLLFCCVMNHALKKGQSRHNTMHHFHAITPIILLFHESGPKDVITPNCCECLYRILASKDNENVSIK